MTDLLLCSDSYANISSNPAWTKNAWQSPAEDFFQCGRFLKHAEGAWLVPTSLPPPPSAQEQDVAEGLWFSATAQVRSSMPEIWGSRRLRFFPDLLVSPGLQNKAPCLPSNITRILKRNAIAVPVSSISHGMPRDHNHCQISRVFCEWHQGDRCRMK